MTKFRLHQYVAVDGTAMHGGYGEPSFYIGYVRKIEIGADGIVYFIQFAPGTTWAQHQEAELFEAAVLVSPQVGELIIREGPEKIEKGWYVTREIDGETHVVHTTPFKYAVDAQAALTGYNKQWDNRVELVVMRWDGKRFIY